MNVLIIRGGWAGHSPVETTSLFLDLFAEHTVRVSDTLETYDDRAALAAADLIVQCWTGGALTASQEANLVDRVAAGAGFAGWHGGVVATFYEASRYQYMVGGRFLCHPGGFVDHRVAITSEHPITAGVADFDVHTEQYFCHVDPGLDVLATTTFEGRHGAPETAGVTMPVVWTRRFGAGRVFVNTLGHSPADLLVPPTDTITRRGLQWAAGLPVSA
ncbi:ThuA domain-containing protein [Actinoplanes sp. NPDC051411]|uniref:ThuA domain-containing protein n=1 Tax=Actinoplanes sp. NPDC051411 TaxID=3155522 RepID=UPI003437D210